MQSIQMNATRQAPHICRSEIESPEDPVFAGAPFSVRVIANCPEDCDLSGARLVAATAAGEIAAHAMFEDAEGGASAQLRRQKSPASRYGAFASNPPKAGRSTSSNRNRLKSLSRPMW